MKYLYLVVLMGLLTHIELSAQMIQGVLTNENQEVLYGATVQWDNTSIGSVTDEAGRFELPAMDTTALLAISYVGYETVYIGVEPHENNLEISVSGITDLVEVEVAAKIRDNYVSTIDPINTEVIGSGELRKAPCCSLAESFETNASVDVAFSDALTGIRMMQLLGLQGKYTQMMVEKRPSMGGLGSSFALEYLPGSWLHSIQIAKGAGSVQSGYQSITGQINSELTKPFDDKRLFVNLYGSTFGRGEANIRLNKQFSEKWSAGLLLNGSTRHNKLDQNKDGFYDSSQKDMLDGMLRLFYRGDVLRAQFNVHAVGDKHIAGQIVPDQPTPGSRFFTIDQQNRRVELFGKFGYLGFDNPNTTMGFITNASWHKLDAFYGNKWHRGDQRNFYANWIFTSVIGSPDHKWSTGASYLYDDYNEQLNDTDFSRTEHVPGVFAEYTYAHQEEGKEEGHGHSFAENVGVVAGIRLDHHNLFGWLVTPRLNAKYNFSENSILRAALGRGYRTANAIAENVGLLASSRQVVVTERLKMEDAWNMGMNFTQNFNIGRREGSITFDAYRTKFNNQVIADREHDPGQIIIYNLDGLSFANSFLAVFSLELVKGLDMKLAYKFNDVKIDFLHGFNPQPFVAKHRGLITLDYETPDKKWMINTSMKLVGKQRFPDNTRFPDELVKDHTDYSPSFAIVNAQLTRTFGPLEIYAGVENITGYTQKNAIIDAENPFGDYFDASQIYAPINGAMGYFGLRYDIE